MIITGLRLPPYITHSLLAPNKNFLCASRTAWKFSDFVFNQVALTTSKRNK